MAFTQSSMDAFGVLKQMLASQHSGKEADKGRAMQLLAMKLQADEAEQGRLFTMLRDEQQHIRHLNERKMESENKLRSLGILEKKLKKETAKSGITNTDAKATNRRQEYKIVDDIKSLNQRLSTSQNQAMLLEESIKTQGETLSRFTRAAQVLTPQAYHEVRALSGGGLADRYAVDKKEFEEAVELLGIESQEEIAGLRQGMTAIAGPEFARAAKAEELRLREKGIDTQSALARLTMGRKQTGQGKDMFKKLVMDRYTQKSDVVGTFAAGHEMENAKKYPIPQVLQSADDVTEAMTGTTRSFADFAVESYDRNISEDGRNLINEYEKIREKGDSEKVNEVARQITEYFKKRPYEFANFDVEGWNVPFIGSGDKEYPWKYYGESLLDLFGMLQGFENFDSLENITFEEYMKAQIKAMTRKPTKSNYYPQDVPSEWNEDSFKGK